MPRRLRARHPVRLLALGLLFLCLVPASASPPPAARPGAVLRILDAGMVDGRPRLGLEIALEPGWKTYWRTPGDAGIPPAIDWSKSTGIAALEPRFPVPVRFGDEGAASIGYVEPVILPLDVTLADPTRPATLDLDVLIGVCHDICLPVSTRMTVTLAAAGPTDAGVAARLAEARARLPVPVDPAARPRIVSIERVPGSPDVVHVTVAEASDGPEAERDLLVEGPDDGWALPQPTPVVALIRPPTAEGRRDRTTIWGFALDGAPASADLAAAELRFTLRVGGRAYEQTVGLDGTGVLP